MRTPRSSCPAPMLLKAMPSNENVVWGQTLCPRNQWRIDNLLPRSPEDHTELVDCSTTRMMVMRTHQMAVSSAIIAVLSSPRRGRTKVPASTATAQVASPCFAPPSVAMTNGCPQKHCLFELLFKKGSQIVWCLDCLVGWV